MAEVPLTWNRKNLNSYKILMNSLNSFLNFSDYEDFKNDLEEDPEMRQHINIYKDTRKINIAVDVNDLADPSIPQITLEEMMDELVIEDVEMGDA